MSTNDASPEGVEPPPVVHDGSEGMAAPKFCATCGSRLAAPGAACGRCEVRSERLERAAREVRLGGQPLRTALGLYGAILAVHLTAWLLAALADPKPGEVVLDWWIQGIDTLIVAVWCLARRRDVAPMLARGAGAGWYAAAFAASFVTWAAATLLMECVRALLHGEDRGMTDTFFEAGYGWGAVVLTVCVQPAVVEELAFRGVILGALLHLMKPREAVLVSAIMFAGLHLNPVALPHLILMGTVLGLLQARTRSIYPGMVLHFSHNLWCCLAEPLHLFGGDAR